MVMCDSETVVHNFKFNRRGEVFTVVVLLLCLTIFSGLFLDGHDLEYVCSIAVSFNYVAFANV